MAVKAKQQYYADNVTLKKEAREFGMIDELKEKLDSVEWGAQVNVIEEVQENGVPLEIVDKTVNVLVPEVIDNLYTIDPNNSLSAKQGKILYDMIKNLLSRGRFLSTWNTATGLPLTNPEESPYPYKAGDYYIVGVTAQEGGTNFRPEPVEYVINVASDEQETSEVHVSDIYVYDGEKWILLINSTRELAVDDYVDYTYQSTNPVENQAIARELAKKQNIFHYIGNTAPTPQNEGDEWYDTANDKLKVWDGTQWVEVGNGETYTAGLHITIDPNDNNKISVVEWSATASSLGLVKLGSDTVQSTSPNNVTSTTGRTYRIQANGSGQLMVNVPWTDTTYSAGTGIAISNNRVISCTVKPVTVGPTAPSTPGTGDLWYDTNKNTMFLYKNNAWTIIGPEIYPITKADYDALTPAEQGDGRFFLITDNDGTIYVDWDNVQNRPMYIGATAPSNPCEGYIWYDTTNDVLKIYNGTQWNEVGGGGGCCYTAGTGININANDEISIDTTVVATKTDLNSKQDVFHTTSSTAPSNPNEGDEWYDTTNDVLKVYDGTNWIVTGKTYTAGNGINIDSNNEISVDTTVIQEKLVSGTNIKTVNNTSLLGNGNIDIPSGKNDIYVGTTAPSDTSVLWLNNSSSSDRRLLYYDRGNWKPLGKTFVESRAPSNVDEGDLWFDESNDTLKVYDASGWNAIEIVHTGGSAPYEYRKGALWIDNYDVLYYYNIDSGRTPIATLFVSNTNPKSEYSYWYDGQMRYDTANNVLKIHKGYNRLTGDDTADWYPFIQAYTAGDGINITSGEISVDVTDIIGNGLSEDANNNIIIDSTIVALKSDLSNYYTKTETYTKTEVDNLIANVGSFEVVATLPSADTADTKKIYLLGPIGTGADKYEEWIVTEDSQQQKQWTKIGETSVDLSGYATISAMNAALLTKADASDLNTKTFTLSSTSDLTTAQAAYDWYAAGKNPIIIYNSIAYILAGVSTGRLKFAQAEHGVAPYGSYTKDAYLTVSINHSSGTVSSVTVGLDEVTSYLDTNTNYSTPYTPTYAGSPATKKYVDDRDTYIGTSEPTSNKVEGRLWYDTTNDVLKVYDGTNWNATGKTYTEGDGIDIDANNEISVDVTDIIGTGLSEDANNNIIVDTDVVQEKLTAGEGISIGEGQICIEESDRRGPAPSGFHIPSEAEWNLLNDVMVALQLTTGNQWRINLHMPFAGRRSSFSAGLSSQGSYGFYWFSSPYGSDSPDNACAISLNSSAVNLNSFTRRANGLSVRAFKNTYVVPDSSWTVIQGTLGSVGIFHNATLGLISAGDGTHGITMSDKNLGATTVYNDGDTLTQSNMGNMYQWGNNYGFTSTGTISNTSSTQVDASGYGPGNYYESDTFITGSEDWSSVHNDDLWGDTSNSTHQECTGGGPLTISADTTVLATQTDLSGKQDKATSGSTAPSTTPSYVGQQYIDTTADKMYVATGTSSPSDWTEVGAGSGDMLYSDFGWETLTGANVTLALRGEIEPSANFTVNKPNDLKDGQFYVLRVITGATAYTMTLGTDVTNPYSEDLTLSANTIANFTFLAKDGELELQPSTEIDISGKQDKATSGSTAPSTTPSYIGQQYVDTTNNILYVAKGTSSSSDWIVAGKTYTAGTNISIDANNVISATVNGFNPSNAGTEGQVLTKTSTGYNWADAQGGGGNVIAMTQAEYNALTTEEKNDGKLRIITDAPTEDISVDWANIANKPIELSTQSGNTLTSLKIWVGSQTDYEALATKDPNTLYFTTNVVSGS